MKNKKTIIAVVAIVAFAAIVSTSAYLVLHSPKYALYKINKSLKDHDWETFSKYVDIDAVYTSLANPASDTSDNTIAQGLAKVMVGAMKETIIAQLKNEVENPKNDGKENNVANIFSRPDSIKTKIKIIKSGKVASVHVYSRCGMLNIPAYINIQMRSESWKYVVIGVSTDDINHRTEIVTQALKQYYTIPSQKKITETAKIEFTKISKGCGNSFYGTCFSDLIMIERTITNNSNKDIASIEYKICPKGKTNEEECKYSEDMNIKASSKVEFGKRNGWKYNEFIPAQSAILSLSTNDIEAIPTKIKFSTGDSIVIDEFAYLTAEKKPSIDELVKFMKSNSLEYSDSIATWNHEM